MYLQILNHLFMNAALKAQALSTLDRIWVGNYSNLWLPVKSAQFFQLTLGSRYCGKEVHMTVNNNYI